MINQRVGRRLEVEYLVKLYQFYEDNFYYLQFNDDFKQIISAQEEKVACILQSISNKNKGEN